MTEAQRRAKKNYKNKCYRLYLEFYPGTDADLIDYLKKREDTVSHVKKILKFYLNNLNGIDKTKNK